jgi:hypothetical protein
LQNVQSTVPPPALHVCFADAAIIGIRQVQATVAAAAANEGDLHTLYSGIECHEVKLKKISASVSVPLPVTH